VTALVLRRWVSTWRVWPPPNVLPRPHFSGKLRFHRSRDNRRIVARSLRALNPTFKLFLTRAARVSQVPRQLPFEAPSCFRSDLIRPTFRLGLTLPGRTTRIRRTLKSGSSAIADQTLLRSLCCSCRSAIQMLSRRNSLICRVRGGPKIPPSLERRRPGAPARF
jgi:hypothetical protein